MLEPENQHHQQQNHYDNDQEARGDPGRGRGLLLAPVPGRLGGRRPVVGDLGAVDLDLDLGLHEARDPAGGDVVEVDAGDRLAVLRDRAAARGDAQGEVTLPLLVENVPGATKCESGRVRVFGVSCCRSGLT